MQKNLHVSRETCKSIKILNTKRAAEQYNLSNFIVPILQNIILIFIKDNFLVFPPIVLFPNGSAYDQHSHNLLYLPIYEVYM